MWKIADAQGQRAADRAERQLMREREAHMCPAPHAIPRGAGAVMAGRVEPPDSLDLFCTPPWGTRALIRHVLPAVGVERPRLEGMRAWDPCAGHRHMADVLAEAFVSVHATDVFDYGGLDAVGSFVGEGLDVVEPPAGGVDWIIGNPPFRLALEFAQRAIALAREGVALLLRIQWVESATRFDLFADHPLTAFAPFSGRLAMVKGRWNPEASTATGYAWFVWRRPDATAKLLNDVPVGRLILIPPGAERELTRPDDVARFAGRGVQLEAAAGPLFAERGTTDEQAEAIRS
jgi:hypothetical protein